MVEQNFENGVEARARLAVGTKVDVRSRFVGKWTHGFEVAENLDDGYRIRRSSDGSILGDTFARDDIRPHDPKKDLWWH